MKLERIYHTCRSDARRLTTPERRSQVNDAGRTLAGLIKEMSDLYYLGSSKWRPSREFLLTQSLKPPDPGSVVFGRLMRPVACGPGGLRMAASRTAGGVRDFDGIIAVTSVGRTPRMKLAASFRSSGACSQ